MEGLLGAVLTGLMVLVFLRDWRSALIVILNIPFALLSAVVLLWATGQTINIVHSAASSSCKQTDESDSSAAFTSYKLSDVLAGDPKSNPYLEAGDIVTLPEADQVYVVGNVFMPLTISLKEPITLTRAIAMAGGLKQDTSKDKIRVLRQEPGTSTRKEIIVDLSAIEKKRSDDLALAPNDIIDVPTSAGKSFLRSLVQGVVPGVGQLPVRVVP